MLNAGSLHLVKVLILTPNSWKVEYAKSPLVCRAADTRQRKPAVMKRSGTMATADRRPPGGPAHPPEYGAPGGCRNVD